MFYIYPIILLYSKNIKWSSFCLFYDVKDVAFMGDKIKYMILISLIVVRISVPKTNEISVYLLTLIGAKKVKKNYKFIHRLYSIYLNLTYKIKCLLWLIQVKGC